MSTVTSTVDMRPLVSFFCSATSNHRIKLLLESAVFSLPMVGVGSRRTEPSQRNPALFRTSIYIIKGLIRFLKYILWELKGIQLQLAQD